MGTANLEPVRIDGLSWAPEDVPRSLQAVQQHAVARAMDAAAWYWRRKTWPKRLARTLRWAAIILATAGGLLPMFASWRPELEPVFASILLALSAAAIGFDRFFGFSSNWTRCVLTAQKLQTSLEAFQLDWQRELALLQGRPPETEKLGALLARIAQFVQQTDEIVNEETRMWSEEFRSSLNQLEETVKARQASASQEAQARAVATAPAALEITVTNGDQATGGWVASVDGDSPTSHRGTKAVRNGVAPGVRGIRVAGEIGGQALRGEAAVKVPPDSVAQVTVALQ